MTSNPLFRFLQEEVDLGPIPSSPQFLPPPGVLFLMEFVFLIFVLLDIYTTAILSAWMIITESLLV